MRILNRPMFKYGGPIKEGVMHGMRNGGRAALVGNPVYPKTGGREHHQFVKNIPKYIKPGYWSSLAKPGTLGGKVKSWWLRNKPSWRTKPGIVSGGDASTKAKYISQTMPPVSTLSKAKSWIKENPYWAYGGTGVGMTSGAIPETVGAVAKGGYNLGKKGILQAADLLVHDKWFDQDKWFADREKAKLEAEEKLTVDQLEIERLKKLLESKKIDEVVVDPDKAEKLAKAAQNKRLKSYLDMMGYDRSKRTAIGDALIDASAIVQEGTEEAGSLKEADWGKMINKAIQTTSKRLDKPEQIREAVGLMMTKGAIEKDITKETDALKTKALKLNIEKAQKDLKGTSFFDEVSIAQKAGAGGQTATDRGARNVSADEGIKWRGNIINKEDFKDTFAETKEDTGLDDVTIVENWVGKKIDEGLKVNDGNYTVGDYLVTIKDSVVVNVR